jgi:hypothetical protein
MKFLFHILFFVFTWFSNQVYSNESFFKFTQSIHGVNSGYSIRVAKIWDDFDNGLYLSDLNIYNAANDGTVLLDDIIELSSIKLRRPNGTFADVEYRIVITSQGKVRMISKFNLDNKIYLFKINKIIPLNKNTTKFRIIYNKSKQITK